MTERTASFNLDLFGRGSVRKRASFLAVFLILSVFYAYGSDYNLTTGLGNLSMVFFIAANIYFPAKRLRLKYRFDNVQYYFDRLLVYHIWLNTASFVVACIHAYITPWSNNWLILALSIMGWLTFGGFLMWIKYPPARVKKGVYILHTQQILFVVLIVALLKGHYVI